MQTVHLNLGTNELELQLPSDSHLLGMQKPRVLTDPVKSIRAALQETTYGSSLPVLIQKKLQNNPAATAVIVISDNTRPVPYKGENGILWPIIECLLSQGVTAERILILVATGTHRAVTEAELREMVDPRVFTAGVKIENHDCDDQAQLVYLGKTVRGSAIYINKEYVNADIKILTGLVESHFMAGASGGRKAVCPGLVGRESTYVFHGAPMLASAQARDLVLEGNPCHEEALEVAEKAGADYIANVTLDHEFNLTGVFCGDLRVAHEAAVQRVKEYVAIPLEQEYDIVVTHGGFVGINHYQCGKAGVVAIPALKKNGRLIMIANTTDYDQVGSLAYRTALQLLKLIGAEHYNQLILSPDWVFLPDQWQVQMWARLLEKVPPENVIYFSPPMSKEDCQILPSYDGNLYLPKEKRYRGDFSIVASVVEVGIIEEAERIKTRENRRAKIAFLADGPYGIPL